jgi:hypothetical protein
VLFATLQELGHVGETSAIEIRDRGCCSRGYEIGVVGRAVPGTTSITLRSLVRPMVTTPDATA